MINEMLVLNWKEKADWQTLQMIEQDLILSKALVCLFANEEINDKLVFRGGTALNKLFLKPSSRYSEDLDFVQKHRGPIGDILSQIRELLDPWLGIPKRKLTARSAKLLYRYTSIEGNPAKLKIEINVTEHFQVLPLQYVPFEVDSKWFQGSCKIPTYALEELMATKLRALYQRRKGRDLFDMWLVMKGNMVDLDKVISIFQQYCDKDGNVITGKLFISNMELKRQEEDFQTDMRALLPENEKWDFNEAFDFVMEKVISKLP
jgi:predicted nucleotidyltransferase component of viral defense system